MTSEAVRAEAERRFWHSGPPTKQWLTHEAFIAGAEWAERRIADEYEDLRRGLQDIQSFLESEVCDDVATCRHPACEAWIVAGLTLANTRGDVGEEVQDGE
jgi:hypothetical protein